MSGFVYNFPHCSCASPYLLNQAAKIAEEAREVACAVRLYKARDDDAFDAREQARLVNDIAMETMDVIHAAETMLRMLDVLVDVDGCARRSSGRTASAVTTKERSSYVYLLQ